MSPWFFILLFFVSLASLVFSTWSYFSVRHTFFGHKFTNSKISYRSQSSFLGQSIDLWAGLYFLILSVLAFLTIFVSDHYRVFIFMWLLFGTFSSIYLVSLKIFVFREFCDKRSFFGLIPVIFLVFFIFFTPVSFVFSWFTIFYSHLFLLATVLSVIGATLALVSFFVFILFMKDMLITKKEAVVLSLISDMVWFLIFGLLSVGVVLITTVTGVFEMQVISLVMGIVAVIAVCEFTKVSRIRPALILLSQKKSKGNGREKELVKRLAFGVESISLISWLSVAFFFITPFGVVDFFQATGMYVLLIIIAFLLSQLTTSNLYGND